MSIHRQRGVTLIELLVAMAIIVVIISVAAPSFTRMIEMQRLRSITSQVVTDMQYARGEAVKRNVLGRVIFGESPAMTCYTIYISQTNTRCDCLLGPGAACTGGDVEIKTVQIPASVGVQVTIPLSAYSIAFAFDHVTGGLYRIPIDLESSPLDEMQIDTALDSGRKLRVQLNRAGRPTVCAPSGSTLSDAACKS